MVINNKMIMNKIIMMNKMIKINKMMNKNEKIINLKFCLLYLLLKFHLFYLIQ